MASFTGKWIDLDKAEIVVEQSGDQLTVIYASGRGPFEGKVFHLASPICEVDFKDGVPPAAGLQAGLMDFNGNTITWSNETVWRRV